MEQTPVLSTHYSDLIWTSKCVSHMCVVWKKCEMLWKSNAVFYRHGIVYFKINLNTYLVLYICLPVILVVKCMNGYRSSCRSLTHLTLFIVLMIIRAYNLSPSIGFFHFMTNFGSVEVMHTMRLKLIGYVFVIGIITISVHDIYTENPKYIGFKINRKLF